MVGDIALGASARIKLLQSAFEVAQEPLRPYPARRATGGRLVHQHRKRVRDRASFEHERAVHVAFAKLEFGIEQDCAFGCGGGEARPAGAAGAATKDKTPPPGRGEQNLPPTHELQKQYPKPPAPRPPPPHLLSIRRRRLCQLGRIGSSHTRTCVHPCTTFI